MKKKTKDKLTTFSLSLIIFYVCVGASKSKAMQKGRKVRITTTAKY
jgi:hypothetical protein